MIDRKPRLIARCADITDVVAAVNFGRENGLRIAVRGGGHNGAGLGVCDDGLVIDLSQIKYVRVDASSNTVRVGGGNCWGDVDHAAHPYGLAVPTGIISTTGVAGLTLGGGHGYLSRKYGLTIDNLLEADVVTADGKTVTASESENPDLFWALRGGGGNFGVVTSFKFKAHPVDTVIAGPTFWPIDQASEVLKWYREFMTAAPEDLYGFFAFLTVPPVPTFPEALHMKNLCGVIWCYTGPEKDAERTFQPIESFGKHLLHHVGPMPFPALQSMFDGLYPAGHQWYWRGDFIGELSDEAIEQHIKYGSELPTPLSTMHLYPIDGAVNRVGRTDTAFRYRDEKWSMVIAGVDPDPVNKERITSWTKQYWEALHPFSAGGAYVNFMMDEGEDRVHATYRENYDRLKKIKGKYDPNNLFRVNQNVNPKG
jgi:hypothetical protein